MIVGCRSPQMSQDPPSVSSPPARRRRFDLQLWLVTLIAACVVIPRAALVCMNQNESVDDDYHLRRGLLFWTREDVRLPTSHPPLGGAISALPMFLLGCDSRSPVDPRTLPAVELAPHGPRVEVDDPGTPSERRVRARAGRRDVLYGQPLPPQTLLLVIGIWKAILFVPFVTLMFSWCRALYGPASGWMASLLLMFEPNVAAHIHSPAVDVLGIEAVVTACYVAWRYAQTRSKGWLAAMAAVTAFAMLVKHLAVILPVVLAAYLVIDAITRRRPMRGPGIWRPRLRRIALAVLIWGVSLWALTGFDVSVPCDFGGAVPWSIDGAPAWKRGLIETLDAQLTLPTPAGQYIGSTFHILRINAHGHWGYLFGEHRVQGWWYYYPAVATYKVPLGVALLFVMALASLRWVKPRVGELALLVPFAAWGSLALGAQMNVGWRHAMPAYAFALLLATRAAAPGAARWLRATAWVGVAVAALHGLSYHPDYLAYLNWPRSRVYLRINDSNVDWGQSIRPIAEWIDSHQDVIANRPVSVRAFGDDRNLARGWYLGHRAKSLNLGDARPTFGVLIISPVHVAGLYDTEQTYAALADIQPDHVIARTMLVYDMDKLVAAGFTWPPPAKGHPFTDVPPVLSR